MIKKAFTLPETMVALTIIGIIAAMVLPILINQSNQNEYKARLKKAYTLLNQAVKMQYALEGTTVADYNSATEVRDKIFAKRLNIASTETGDGYAKNGDAVFYTVDGFMFAVKGSKQAGCTNAWARTPCYEIIIDINGDKKPNEKTADTKHIKDGFHAILYPQAVSPNDDVSKQILYEHNLES